MGKRKKKLKMKEKNQVAIIVRSSSQTLKIIYVKNERMSLGGGKKKRQCRRRRHQLQKAFILINSFLLH